MNAPKLFEVSSCVLDRMPVGIRFSPDSELLHAYDGRTLYTWSVPEFSEVGRFSIDLPENSFGRRCRFMNGGKDILLITSDNDSEEGIHHFEVRDLESHTPKVEGNVHVKRYGLWSILFNCAEDRLIFRDYDHTTHVVEFPSCVHKYSVRFASAESEIYSPDESELWAVCGYDEPQGYREYLTAFDPVTGASLRSQTPAVGDYIDGIHLSPNGRTLLTVEEQQLCLRHPDSWELMYNIDLADSLQEHWGRSRPAATFAHNAPLVAVSCDHNSRICIVDLENRVPVGVYDVEEGYGVQFLLFSPDDRLLACASFDSQKNVKVWDVSHISAT